jgi:hypothetical protein
MELDPIQFHQNARIRIGIQLFGSNTWNQLQSKMKTARNVSCFKKACIEKHRAELVTHT